ncbi:MAG: glucose 1-dehydrogenase [Stappiaceae bacterium]
MELSLSGKVAIVTGASGGIGSAIAQVLAEEGMKVVVNHHSSADQAKGLCNALGSSAIPFAADVGREDDVEAMVAFAESEFGGLDLMVHNAGITSRTSIVETSFEDWQRVRRTNLDGAYYCARFAARSMIARKVKGSFIAISSIHGKVAKAEMGAYCASKAGIDMLVRQLAAELAPYGIRSNAVAPGTIDTGMNPIYHATDPESIRRRNRLFDRIPLAGLAEPRTIGDAVAFLASDRSSYTTGEIFYVDGGYTADGTPR